MGSVGGFSRLGFGRFGYVAIPIPPTLRSYEDVVGCARYFLRERDDNHHTSQPLPLVRGDVGQFEMLQKTDH